MNLADKFATLAHDKALHAIGGSFVAMAAASLACVLARPQWAWWVALLAALFAGGLVEWRQSRANKKALTGAMPRDVSPQDVVATVAGAVPVAVPLLVLTIFSRGTT